MAHHRRTAAGFAACLLLGLVSCGGASDGTAARSEHPATAPTTRPTTSTAATDRATNLADLDAIGRYVAAMNRKDIDAAWDLRCQAERIDADDEDLFREHLDRLLDDNGEITTKTVEPELDRLVTPVEHGADERTYAIQYQTAGGLIGSPLYLAMIGQDGGRRLCGANPLLVDVDELAVHDSGSTEASPRELMPSVSAPGYEPAKDESFPPDDEYRETSTWFRAWTFGDEGGGASAFGSQHPSDAAASAAAKRTLGRYAPGGVATFDVPGLPKAVGLTVMADAWLMIQPPGTSPTWDVVVQRFGNRLVVVRVTDQPGSRDLVVALAQQAHDLALG